MTFKTTTTTENPSPSLNNGIPIYMKLPSTDARKCGKNFAPFKSSLLAKLLLLIVFLLLLLIVLPPLVQYASDSDPNKPLVPDSSPSDSDDAFEGSGLLRQFLDFQKRFSKEYPSIEEELRRFAIFIGNLRELQHRIRTQQEQGSTETQFGVTQFFDWTDEELTELIMPFDTFWGTETAHMHQIREFRPANPNYRRPKEFDWRKKGVVAEVKNQVRCGACWAFSATAVVESQHAIHNGTLVTLSEQQLIDCDHTNNGCDGGYRPNAFRYVRDNGLMRDSGYPYHGSQGRCELPPGPVDPTQRVFIDELQSLPSDEDQIADFIVEKGPVSFGMNVTKSLYHYSGGIFHPTPAECAQQAMGAHSMEAVGFGEDSAGTPFWILKNSWGTGYGIDGGYVHVRRGVDACGISREVHTALITRY